jgi:aryl-alcohol dehydrogenase-like predicted oxidoreductase
MEKIRLGKSDMLVAPLGVGAMAWSNSRLWGYGDKFKRADVAGAFQASIHAGLTLFDTAEIYGRGYSERVLGELVRAEPLPLYVATKYAPLPTRLSARALTKALDKSLERLGLDHVDLYQIHFPSGWVKIEALMNALADAVDAGKTRYVGVSNYSADQMRRAYDALAKRGVPLVSNQVEYSLIRRGPEVNGVLDACRELDVTLIAYSPLGRGALTGKYRPGASASDMRRFYGQFRSEALKTRRPLIEAMQEIGAAHGDKTPAQVALNWLARQPGVLPIPGAKNEEQARQNAEAINWHMSDKEAERLDGLSIPFRG